ncbi:MAG: hypothetical protein ACK4FA_00980 [Candidatus Paceibacteria bacterium]
MEKLKIAGIIVLVGVAGVLGYILLNDKGTVSSEENKAAEEQSGKKMAFSQFIKLNTEPYKCSVSQAFSDMENSGVVYIDGARIRGEFDTIVEGKNMHSSFIMKDGFAYNWSDLYPMGAKVKVDTSATSSDSNTSTSGTYTWNADQIGEYDCVLWQVDESLFNVPTNINFTEL